MGEESALATVRTQTSDNESALCLDTGPLGDDRKLITNAETRLDLYKRARQALHEQDQWNAGYHAAFFDRLVADWPKPRGHVPERRGQSVIAAWLLCVAPEANVGKIIGPMFGLGPNRRDRRLGEVLDAGKRLAEAHQRRERQRDALVHDGHIPPTHSAPLPRLPRVYRSDDLEYDSAAAFDLLADGARHVVLDFSALRTNHEEVYVALLTHPPDADHVAQIKRRLDLEPSDPQPYSETVQWIRDNQPAQYQGLLHDADAELRRQRAIGGKDQILNPPVRGGPYGSLQAVTRALNRDMHAVTQELTRR